MAYFKDVREHLAALEAAKLLVRVDREINKDTQLHPLVRVQFRGLPERERRAFLFTTVGISSRGGAVDLLMQLIVQKNGLMPNKDVISLVVGGQESTVLALRVGRIAAALLTPPRPLTLQREGFSRIAYSGDYMPNYPSGGIGVTDEKIKTGANEVFAFVKASVRGLQFARQNRAEGMKILAGYFSIKDQGLTEEFFDLYLSRLLADGSVDDELLNYGQRSTLSKIRKTTVVWLGSA